MAASGIYEIVNLVNGKRYVGSAKDFGKRWNAHRMHLRRGTHHSRHLQASWKKHGEDAFAFRVVRECAVECLIEEEQRELDAGNWDYNICRRAGSTLGFKFSDESKAKLSAKAKGRKCPPRSAEYRAKISAAHKGRPKDPNHIAAMVTARREKGVSEEERAKHSANTKARWERGEFSRERSPEYRAKIAASLRGRKATPEHRANQSAAQRGRKHSEESKQKRSLALKGRRPSDATLRAAAESRRGKPPHNKGKPMSAEQKAKLSAARTGKKLGPRKSHSQLALPFAA